MAELRTWKSKESKIVYSNKWISVREHKVIRPDGSEGIYGVIEDNPGVSIIALDKQDNIYLVREDRFPVSKFILNLPAGTISKGANPLESAKQELYEETGIKANKLEYLGKFYHSPNLLTSYELVYLATDLDLSGLSTRNQESAEAINEIVKINLSDLKERISKGDIENSTSLSALHLFLIKKELSE